MSGSEVTGRRWGRAGPVVLIGLLVIAGCRGGAAGAGGAASDTGQAGSPASSPASSPGSAPSAPGSPATSGQGSPQGTGGAVTTALCANPSAVTRVDVVRLLPIDKSPVPVAVAPAIPIPVRTTITDPAQARKLAGAVCALPLMPSGVINCPAAIGGAVELRFTARGRPLPMVVIGTSGCETVQGLGKARWAAQSPRFWAVLGQVAGNLGIPHSP